MKVKQVRLVERDPGTYLIREEATFVANGEEIEVRRVLDDEDESIEPGETVVLLTVDETEEYKLGFTIVGTVTIGNDIMVAYENITRGETKLWVIERENKMKKIQNKITAENLIRGLTHIPEGVTRRKLEMNQEGIVWILEEDIINGETCTWGDIENSGFYTEEGRNIKIEEYTEYVLDFNNTLDECNVYYRLLDNVDRDEWADAVGYDTWKEIEGDNTLEEGELFITDRVFAVVPKVLGGREVIEESKEVDLALVVVLGSYGRCFPKKTVQTVKLAGRTGLWIREKDLY